MIETLQRLKRSCGPRTIIGGDIRAFSTRWGGKKTNSKGKLVEDFIDNEHLVLMNLEGQPYTFSGPRGENNIDITLVTQDLSATISNWKVLDGIITSDHRIIYFEVGQGKTFSKLNVK